MDIGRWKSECQYVGFLADQVSHYADRFAEGRIDQKAMDYAMNELCAAACELKRIAAMDRLRAALKGEA